jgi:hypothetical protein
MRLDEPAADFARIRLRLVARTEGWVARLNGDRHLMLGSIYIGEGQ